MAGGLGSRFWPMSQADNPKQFIDILGTGQSMLQTTFARMEMLCRRENIIIVTSAAHANIVHEQIPGLLPYQVLSEPVRRNTAPCIAYAAAVIGSLCPDATVVVTPSDHAVFGSQRFADNLADAIEVVQTNDWVVTVGVQPTNPNSKYGYIQYSDNYSLPNHNRLHPVVTFTEKPPVEVAQQFIASGEFFWNSGLLVWSLPVLKAAYERLLPAVAASFFSLSAISSDQVVAEAYATAESISVDIGIMEKLDNVHVLEASFGWSNIETWESLYITYPHDTDGNAPVSGNIFLYDVKNTVVHVPNNQNVVVKGLNDYIVAAGGDTILICPRADEEQLFRFSNDVELKQLIGKQNAKSAQS